MVQSMYRLHQQHYPHSWAECQGMAAGAGVDLNDVSKGGALGGGRVA